MKTLPLTTTFFLMISGFVFSNNYSCSAICGTLHRGVFTLKGEVNYFTEGETPSKALEAIFEKCKKDSGDSIVLLYKTIGANFFEGANVVNACVKH